ncbi:hypothetical protein N0V88_000413 [Collariella sp. IMI 366227]|nr:hypothetical protein N0V88_000413 [Collariella sp. IMI 366227]
MSKQPTTWDSEAHLALLQAIIMDAPPSPAQWERVLERVAQKGYNYTASAAIKLSLLIMAAERMTWDHHADHDLLTAITQELQPSQEQLRAVMGRMHDMGYTCSVKAITQHLQKLRRKEGKDAADGGSAGPATPKTPAGRKRGAKKEPASGSKRKARASAEDDDDEDVKPFKKVKEEEQKVKQEEVDGDSDVEYA